MSVNGKFEGITRADLLELADRFLVPGAVMAFEQVLGAVGRWPEYAEEAGVPGSDIDRIGTDLGTFTPR